MSNLTFTSVTEENRSEFHRLMQQYAKELDEHQNRTTDSEMLRATPHNHPPKNGAQFQTFGKCQCIS